MAAPVFNQTREVIAAISISGVEIQIYFNFSDSS
ncbi:hypothetical protein U4U10_25005 [Escherichia coli]|nr:hypothetical protein [Escherichia coli]